MALRMFMSSGTGWRMISLKKSWPNSMVLSHSTGSSGRRGFQTRWVFRATGEVKVSLTCVELSGPRSS